MYLSKPPITVSDSKQLAKKPSVELHRGKGNTTTVMVRDDSTRHPVTQQWLSRYQNKQTVTEAAPTSEVTKGGMFTAGKRKGL